MTVRQLSFYYTALSTYRIRKHQEPEYLYRIMSRDNRSAKIIIPNTRLSLAKHSYCFRGSVQWNLLPETVRNCQTVTCFKKLLKKWIHENVPQFANTWGLRMTKQSNTRSPVKKLMFNLMDTSN